MFDLRVKNANIVTSQRVFSGEIYVKDGKIAAITAPNTEFPATETVDAAFRAVLPGVIDPHVHAGHGTPERETFRHASAAAAAGGVTTVLEQPLSVPITITPEAFLDKKEAAQTDFHVDFGIWGGLVPGALQDMPALAKLGAGAFKSFMCRCSNYPTTNDGVMLEGLRILATFGGVSCAHAESDSLIQELVDKFNAQDYRGPQAFIDSHPPYSETEAVLRYIFLLRQAPGAKGHIAHCSVPEAIRAVHAAQQEGIDITVETCPQYLGLTHADLFERGGVAKCDPPARSAEMREDLWKCVLDGQVDMIVSDHSPHPFDRKVVPMERFTDAAEGVMGLETMLPVVLEEGVFQRGLQLTAVARLMSENPAKRFGLWGRKGALEVGFDADFNLIDLNRSWTCKAENMHYLNKHTPFDGREFRGRIDATYIRGQLVSLNREIQVEPGFGKFYPMEMKV